MDSQVLFNIAVAIAGFFGGWVLNNIHRSIDRLDTDVRAMPHTYVTREDYKDDIRDVRDMLTKIFDKLDHKQDK
jgi:low affinity Fe/Cu permease